MGAHVAPHANSYWIYPSEGGPEPPQFTWMVGEQHNLSWFTLSHQTFNISLAQQIVPSTELEADTIVNINGFVGIEDTTSFVWTVELYQFDLNLSNIFFFWVNVNRADAATSAYFNIANNQSESPSVTATPTFISSTTTLLPSHTPNISTIQSPTSSSSSSPASNGISISANEYFGISLGIGIPVVIVILTIVFVLLKRVKSKRPKRRKFYELPSNT